MAKAEDTMMNCRVQRGGVGALPLPFSSSVGDSIVDELPVFVLLGFVVVIVFLVVLPFMVEPVIGDGCVGPVIGDGCGGPVIGDGGGGSVIGGDDDVVDGSTGLALLVKTLYLSLG
jgi:hypothetical protein